MVLRLRGGALAGGAVLENVAFNPTIGPLQDALVGALAGDLDGLGAIEDAWLAERVVTASETWADQEAVTYIDDTCG